MQHGIARGGDPMHYPSDQMDEAVKLNTSV
jgi:hypothetical protein